MNKLQNKAFANCLLNLCGEAKNDDEIKYVLGVLHAQASGKTFNLLTDCIEELGKFDKPQQLEIVQSLQVHLLNMKTEPVSAIAELRKVLSAKNPSKDPKKPSPSEVYRAALKELPEELKGMTITSLCKQYGINDHSFRSRLRRGFTVMEALTQPVGPAPIPRKKGKDNE